MKTRSVYYLLYFLFAALLITSCKDDDDEEELVGNWKKSSDFSGLARSEATCFVINNRSYVCLGYDGDERLSDLWEYNLDNDSWVKKANFPGTPRTAAVSFVIGNKAYITTGYDGENKLKDTWEYDQETNTWTPKEDFAGSARFDAIGFSLNGYGYVGTGNDGNHLKDIFRYDPATDTWTAASDIGGSKRMAANVFVIDGKAYVCGGLNNGSYVSDFWMFDGTSWEEKNQIRNYSNESFDNDYSIVRQYGVSFVIKGKAYFTGGVNTSVLKDTWEYDPLTDLWEEKTSFEGTPRYGAVAFSLSDRGFVLTGRNGGYRFDDCWELMPTDKYNDKD